jgi:enamine deaminase RidA (YjgF/YER057c/UK114 family)
MTRTLISSGYGSEDTYGYSRAVVVGDLCWVSGTTARGVALEADVAGQMRDALVTIEAALAEADFTLADTVRTVAYVTDMADADAVSDIHGEVFGQIKPASTIVAISALSPAAARVEIELTAARSR